MSDNILSVFNEAKLLKERKSQRLLIAYTIVLALLTFYGSSLASPFALVMIFVMALYNKYLALAIYFSTMIIHPGFSVLEVFVSLTEISIIGISIMAKKMNNKTISLFIVTTLFIFFMVLGMIAGARSKFDTILLFGFNLYLVVFITQMIMDTNDKLILDAMFFSGIVIAIYVGYNYMMGNLDTFTSEQGRLGYQENAKTLATSVAIPVFMALNKFFNKSSRKNKGELLFYVIVFFICFPVFLLTYARGVTIALAISILVLMITNSGRFKFYHFLIYALVAFVASIIIVRLEMNTSLWFDHTEGGNGRTEIYKMYYNYMVNKGPGTIIWGIGSASMKEIFGWYPHSTILAYFFHFGIWGAIFVLYEIFITLIPLIKQRKELGFYLGLFVLNLIMFSSHGSYDSVLYCIIIGLCYGIANKKLIE